MVSHLATKLLKDTIVLTKKRSDIFLDNIFFHDTIENRLMLLLFGIDFKSKNVPVYYYDNNTRKMTDDVDQNIKEIIAREKMGDTSKGVTLSGMTDSNPKFTNLIFDETKLKKELLDRSESIEVFPTSIVEYNDFVRLYFGDEDIYFDVEYLINTIPQPFFSELNWETKGHQNHIVKYEFRPLVFVTHKTDFDDKMIYSYNNCFWKRIFVKNNVECIEFAEEDWDAIRFRNDFKYITNEYNVIKVPYGRISSVNVQDSPRIFNIGRFAQWKHSITTEHVINKLINLNV